MISGIFALLGILFFGTLALLAFAFWIWMIIDVIQNKGLAEGEKIGWVIAVVLLHFLGALLYFLIGRPKKYIPPVI